MGLIVTLYLISTNVYNFVDAPHNRGFSYIEVWILGSQFPILLALVEYGFILYLKRTAMESENQTKDQNDMKSKEEEKIKRIDFITLVFSFTFFVTFTIFYWTLLHQK